MIDNILFLIDVPFNNNYYKSFGIDIFKAKGFKVVGVDVTAITHKMLVRVPRPSCCFIDLDLIKLTSKADFKRELSGFDFNSTLIVNFVSFGWRSKFIFDYILKNNIKSVRCFQGALPPIWSRDSIINRLMPKRFFAGLYNRLLGTKLFQTYLGSENTTLVLGGSETEKEYKLPKSSRKILAHSLDYNETLNIAKSCYDPPFAVFLDECLPFHPDNFIVYKKQILDNPSLYYDSLCDYFDYLEDILGFRIKIAAHPKSAYKKNFFGGRDVIYGKTANLAASSQLVLAHMSTSTHYAVIYKKPLVFMDYTMLNGTALEQAPYKFAGLLNCKSYVIIDDKSTYRLKHNVNCVDEKAYSLYCHKYIKQEGTPDINSWDILIKELELKNI